MTFWFTAGSEGNFLLYNFVINGRYRCGIIASENQMQAARKRLPQEWYPKDGTKNTVLLWGVAPGKHIWENGLERLVIGRVPACKEEF